MNSSFEIIADGLADKGYAVIDHFLSNEEISALLSLDEFQTGLLQFKKAGIGDHQARKINEGIRGDFVKWIDPSIASPPLMNYLEKLKAMTLFINSTLFLSLKDLEIHWTIYPAGAGYKRHLDQFKRDDHRKLSVILYLNEDWKDEQGGQLRIHLAERSLDFFPTGGRLVCFRSDKIEHEVLPATRERRSITGWILDQFAELRHL